MCYVLKSTNIKLNSFIASTLGTAAASRCWLVVLVVRVVVRAVGVGFFDQQSLRARRSRSRSRRSRSRSRSRQSLWRSGWKRKGGKQHVLIAASWARERRSAQTFGGHQIEQLVHCTRPTNDATAAGTGVDGRTREQSFMADGTEVSVVRGNGPLSTYKTRDNRDPTTVYQKEGRVVVELLLLQLLHPLRMSICNCAHLGDLASQILHKGGYKGHGVHLQST
jgi:hypothetical protein